ncbi:hypothetical protein [Longimycelium tulufanense]|uniref:hypothetical protein n=1 Tax=Longimycelium tulufanense TaxID=907463 RepID=UPI001E52CB0C|nr:hypothetical protein [Longimycelium tulufanense]
MLRRELLAGLVGVTGGALLGVGRAQAAAPPASVPALRAMVEAAQADYLACRYRELGRALPHLIRTAHATRAAVSSDQHCTVDALTSAAYRHASWLALRLDADRADGFALGLAEDAMAAARASGDLLMEAEAAQMGAVALRRYGQDRQAEQLVINTAVRLESDTGLKNRAQTSAYAMLLETGAYTAAVAGRRSAALDLHTEASATLQRQPARQLGGATTTPSTVDARYLRLYEISVHRQLGDYGTAINTARTVLPSGIGVTERRVRYYQDVALTYAAWDKREPAFRALLAAEHEAPQEVRLRPWAHRLVRDLRSSGPMLPGLRDFATRAHVD